MDLHGVALHWPLTPMPTPLESLLDPISPTEFREQYYGKQPLLIRGHPKKLADLFTWADLNRVLNGMPYPNPHVTIATPRKREEAATHTDLIRSEEHTSELQSRLHLVCR